MLAAQVEDQMMLHIKIIDRLQSEINHNDNCEEHTSTLKTQHGHNLLNSLYKRELAGSSTFSTRCLSEGNTIHLSS